jgi:hypothetical protein
MKSSWTFRDDKALVSAKMASTLSAYSLALSVEIYGKKNK